MRECLGWITSCSNEQSCPMNWLELAVSELPTSIRCHVCEQNAVLVLTEGEAQTEARSGLVAFPVVPCTGFGGVPRTATSMAPQNGAHHQAETPVPEPHREPVRESPRAEPPRAEPPRAEPPRAEPPRAARTWVVTLTNGEMVKLDKDTMVIGRSRTCDVVIPSAKVSRQHASLSRIDGDLYIEDLGSANGVWLNGEKITRAKISAGDSFTISDETMLFDQR